MMNDLQNYIIATYKKVENGELPSFPDPVAPADLGSALTQDEIDTLKRLLKEMKERFYVDIT